jgi:hypothetical protein
MPTLGRDETRGLQFKVSTNADSTWPDVKAHTVLLMDIRDELVKLNALLHCQNFQNIPATLRSIRRAMPVRRKRGTK